MNRLSNQENVVPNRGSVSNAKNSWRNVPDFLPLSEDAHPRTPRRAPQSGSMRVPGRPRRATQSDYENAVFNRVHLAVLDSFPVPRQADSTRNNFHDSRSQSKDAQPCTRRRDRQSESTSTQSSPEVEKSLLESDDDMGLVEPRLVSLDDLHEELSKIVRPCCTNVARNHCAIFMASVRFLLQMVFALEGGAGFVCAPSESYNSLRQLGVDFEATDKNDNFPHGFMTQQLRGKHIACPEHKGHMRTFAQHTEDDKWPEGHEAASLPKDGYTLYGRSGFCRRAAARVIGLPRAPFVWEGVGMRHTTALQLCWALKGHTAVIVVRSDSGKVHVLIPGETSVKVFEVER